VSKGNILIIRDSYSSDEGRCSPLEIVTVDLAKERFHQLDGYDSAEGRLTALYSR
jgi:hypothetical protein